MNDQRFYVWADCPECNGTGLALGYPDVECDACRQTYVEELEQMVSDCVRLSDVMSDGYSEPLVEFVARRVQLRQGATK